MPGRVARWPVLVLAGASLVMLGALLYVGRWLMFWWDEWAFIFDRPDPTARSLLAPFFDTFVAVPVVVYQALLAAFGMRTYVPYLLVDWAAHFAIAFLLYRTVSRRSGVFLGLAAGISVIFLGSGFEVLLQPFQIQFQFAIVSGLLTIDQIDTGRRRVASIALVFGVASSGLGVIFAGLVALWGILRRDGATVLAAMPGIAVYAAWFFTWGRESGQLAGPRLGALDAGYSVVYGIGAALSGVIGLPPARFAIVGIALATAVLIGGGILARRGYRPDPLAVAAIAALAAEQVLRAIHRGQFGVEYGARSGYVYAGSIFVWLAISGLIGGRLSNRRAASILIAILIVPMVLGNMRQFAGAAVQHRTWRATELAELRLIESLRSDPRLALDVQPDDTRAIGITARSYLSAIDRFGRPTLEYDWQPFIDPAAVEAARRRLLPESP